MCIRILLILFKISTKQNVITQIKLYGSILSQIRLNKFLLKLYFLVSIYCYINVICSFDDSTTHFATYGRVWYSEFFKFYFVIILLYLTLRPN